MGEFQDEMVFAVELCMFHACSSTVVPLAHIAVSSRACGAGSQARSTNVV